MAGVGAAGMPLRPDDTGPSIPLDARAMIRADHARTASSSCRGCRRTTSRARVMTAIAPLSAASEMRERVATRQPTAEQLSIASLRPMADAVGAGRDGLNILLYQDLIHAARGRAAGDRRRYRERRNMDCSLACRSS